MEQKYIWAFHKVSLVAEVKVPSDYQLCFPGHIVSGWKIPSICAKILPMAHTSGQRQKKKKKSRPAHEALKKNKIQRTRVE